MFASHAQARMILMTMKMKMMKKTKRKKMQRCFSCKEDLFSIKEHWIMLWVSGGRGFTGLEHNL